MLTELRTRLGGELERLSHELTMRMPVSLVASENQRDQDAARESERVVQRRIRLLGQLVAGLSFVDSATILPDRAGYGSVVGVRDLAGGQKETFTLMTGDFIDLADGQVSLASPIGHALLGRHIGDVVSVTTPRGERRYEVLELVTLPQKLGLTNHDKEPAAVNALRVA